MKNILRSENGQVLVITVLCMAMLIAALGFAIDVGVLFRARRNVQIAADAAAMAGATAAFYGNDVTSAANNAAAAVDPAITSAMVTVTQSPSLAGNLCSSCVQVNLYKPTPTIFMSTFSKLLNANNFSPVNVSAKSIGGAPATGVACGYVMNPTASDALWLHGAGAILAPGCGMYVNSNASDALCVTGNAGKSNFAWVAAVGTQGSQGNCKGTISSNTSVYTNVAAQTSPWDYLPDPGNQCKTASNPSGTITPTPATTLTGSIVGPGAGSVACYSNGSNPVTLNNANLGPGIYVFTSGVTVSGTVNVAPSSMGSGGGVLAVTSGALNVQTTSIFNITAPTSGIYSGLALYQSPSDTSQMTLTFGSSGSKFDGMIYAPGAAVDLHDQGGTGATTNFGFVVGELYNNGNINVNFTNYTSAHPNTSPFRIITLVG